MERDGARRHARLKDRAPTRLLALRRARVLIDDFHRVRLPTVPYRHALYAWVPPSPDATCALPKGVRDRVTILTYLLKRERRRSARGRAHENRFRLVSACSHRLSVQQTPTAMHTVASSIQPNTQAPFHRHQTPPLSRRAAHRPSPPRRPPRPAQRIEAGRGCVGTWVR